MTEEPRDPGPGPKGTRASGRSQDREGQKGGAGHQRGDRASVNPSQVVASSCRVELGGNHDGSGGEAAAASSRGGGSSGAGRGRGGRGGKGEGGRRSGSRAKAKATTTAKEAAPKAAIGGVVESHLQ